MTKLAVITMEGKDSQALEFPPGWLETPVKPHLLNSAVLYHRARQRQGTHASLTRSEVRGSNRKVYRQKGTGNARMGSQKVSQRRSGGVAHGPRPRSHAIKMNKKERKQILRAALAERVRTKSLRVIDHIAPESHKTKDFARWLVQQQTPKVLLVVEKPSQNLLRASSNLPQVELIVPTRLNVYKLMRYPQALVSREAMEILQQRLIA